MEIASKHLLVVLAATAAMAMGSPRASAQSQWIGGQPVFQSDIEKRQQEEEARRAEIRRSSPMQNGAYPKFMDGGGKPDIAPEKPPVVTLAQSEKPGTIIVATAERKLYYVLPGNQAYQYPISVGRDGFTWTGTERISRIESWPTWTPPPSMRQRQPYLPVTVTGGVINPLGAKAMYLGSSIYRIHGTSNERTIGRASSSGCFRMLNAHVTHLASVASIGTTVRVMASYQGGSAVAPVSSILSGFGLGDDDPKPTPAAGMASKPKAKAAAKAVKVN